MRYHHAGTGYLSSAMAMDKGITKKIFRTSGVPTPRGVELKKGKDSMNLADYNMELPVVVRPAVEAQALECISQRHRKNTKRH
ncbi:MAG: hypothetical protein ACLVAT_09190 [Lachnospiraceae bacterium]